MSAVFPASALSAVLAERDRQLRFGHDAAADDAAPSGHLARAAHVRLLDAVDLVSGRPTHEELARARRKVIQAAALALAEIERLDRALARHPDT